MGKTPGISGMLVLKSLSCRASCEPLDFLCEKNNPLLVSTTVSSSVSCGLGHCQGTHYQPASHP